MLSKKYGKSISLVTDMEEIDFKLGDQVEQVRQFSVKVDSKDVRTIMEALKDFGKSKGQKFLMAEVLRVTKFLLLIPTINTKAIIFCIEKQ